MITMEMVWSALRDKVRFVIIDNDNLRYSDMVPYVSQAIKTTNYEVHFVRPRGLSEYPVNVLARRNRRGLSEQDLLEMQTNFETFLTVDEFVADLKSQNHPPYPSSSISLNLPPLSSLQSSTTSKSSSNDALKGAPSVDELTDKLLAHSSPLSTEEGAQTFEEKLDHLRCIYPAHKVSRLKAALEEANGDVAYASALIYDGCEFESGLECDESEVIGSNSGVTKSPWHEVAKYIIDNHPSTELIGIPMEQFNNWEPDEHLLKQIRLSLLKHGCRDKSSSKKQCRKKNIGGEFSARYADDLPKSNVEEDLALQKAVIDSIKPFYEVFHDPEVQTNLRELERAYPSVSREAIKEVIVRCDYLELQRSRLLDNFAEFPPNLPGTGLKGTVGSTLFRYHQISNGLKTMVTKYETSKYEGITRGEGRKKRLEKLTVGVDRFDMDRAKVCLDFNLLDAKSFHEATDTTLSLANLQYEELRAARFEMV
ncbi:unnamed protein product [Rodentolepis nana]|uniref:Smr domain-containing protein n=1 Tax=Rodentolepis nana TaxID=102285 RepID=A0A0R3T424_RODNA|nr:unnamed protein product [Rodentolepis nana]